MYRDETARRLLLVGWGFFGLGEIVPGLLGHGQTAHATMPWTVLTDPFFSSAALGIYLLFLWRRPPARLTGGVTLVGLVLEGALWTMRGAMPHRDWLIGCGLGAAAVGGFAALRRTDEEAPAVAQTAFICPWAYLATAWMKTVTAAGHPQVYDLYGWAIDPCWFGVEPSVAVTRLVDSHAALHAVVQTVYNQIALMMTAVRYLNVRYAGRSYTNVIVSLASVGLVGALLYNVFPMVGPRPLWGSGFASMPRGVPHLVDAPVDLPRNCMPSLHTAWILTLYWTIRGIDRRWRWLGGALTLITLMATMSVGGHYLIDLVVGTALGVAMMAATARSGPGLRVAVLLSCGVATGGVLLALRLVPDWFIVHPAATAIGEVGMAGGALVLEQRLFQALVPADGRREM